MKKKILVTCVLLLALTVIVVGAGTRKEETVYNITKESYAKATEILNKDADGDGLKDWEEELWKTDLKNPDTDGDGTADGEEIRLRRNPLLAGPVDTLDETTAKLKINDTLPQTETQTDLLTREFFGAYLTLRQKNGGAITPTDVETLVEGVLADTPATRAGKQFNPTHLTIQGSSIEHLRAYANGVGKIIADHSQKELESEFNILQEALESEQPETLALLDEHIALYGNVVSALLALPIPANATEIHLTILNAFQGLKESDSAIQKLWTDPLFALPAIPLFQQKSAELIAGLTDLKLLLQKNNIRFNASDSGYLLEQIGL